MVLVNDNPLWFWQMATLYGSGKWQPSMVLVNGNPLWFWQMATLYGSGKWHTNVAKLFQSVQA
jgi:hypothetical protein